MPTDRTSLLTTAAAAPAACKHQARGIACLLLGGLALGLSLGLSIPTATAEELSVDEMACALDPQCKAPFVDRRLRGVTATPSVRTPGSFDRTVNFAFNSAELSPAARKELDVVAESLKRPNTKSLEIVIGGHTDAVGGEEYNVRLSERRAEAARDYLINQHGIEPSRLVAKGYGKTQLLLPTEPNNELNRRVQFLNPNYSLSSNAPAAESSSTSAGSPAASPSTAGSTGSSGGADGL